MKTNEEIRRENLIQLISEFGGEPKLAEVYGCTEANIKTMARGYKDSKSGTPKGIGSAAARKFEEKCGKERGWMDHDHSDPALELFMKMSAELRTQAIRASSKDTEPARRAGEAK